MKFLQDLQDIWNFGEKHWIPICTICAFIISHIDKILKLMAKGIATYYIWICNEGGYRAIINNLKNGKKMVAEVKEPPSALIIPIATSDVKSQVSMTTTNPPTLGTP